jgi:hypothetical protein
MQLELLAGRWLCRRPGPLLFLGTEGDAEQRRARRHRLVADVVWVRFLIEPVRYAIRPGQISV